MRPIIPIHPVTATLQADASAAQASPRRLNIRVLRFDPLQPDVEARWQSYQLDDAAGMTLFIAL
ncbi:MAG: hypothetical protein ABI696_17150, partial [Rubrivivax sp.]